MKHTSKLILLLAALACGCGGAKAGEEKLRVGRLDTKRILAEMPKYKDLQSSLVQEQAEFQRSLPGPNEKVSEARVKSLRADAQRRRDSYEKRVNDVVQEAISEIRDKASQVAAEKNLDIVVVDTPPDSAIRYSSGQDVTIDVLVKMKRS